MKSLLIYFTDLDRPCQAFFSSSLSSGNPTAPPAALSNPRLVATIVARCSWLVVRGSLFVARGSWLVKTCHYTRKGCDEISQRAAQGSLYRGAGRQRRSERLKVGPYAQGRGRVFFAICDLFLSHRLYAIS